MAQDDEQAMQAIWVELLDVPVVGGDDNLIELGGNSLVATMLANHIEMIFGVRPSMELLISSAYADILQTVVKGASPDHS